MSLFQTKLQKQPQDHTSTTSCGLNLSSEDTRFELNWTRQIWVHCGRWMTGYVK